MTRLPPDRTGVVAEIRLRNRELQAQWCARRVADLLGDALACADGVTLAVSGGTTPVGFFRRLSEMPLHWERVSIVLVDERWVANDEPDSNEALVREHLLRAEAARATFVPMKSDAPDPDAGVAVTERALDAVNWPLTVCVLGMGTDGHTASLFPDARGLAAGLDLSSPARVVAVHPPGASHARMSLTLATLLAARHLIVLISGDDKWRVYGKALQQSGSHAIEEMPVRAVLNQNQTPVEVFWSP